MKHNIVLVDDHPILTDGFKMMLESNNQFEVIGVFNSASFALSFLRNNADVDLLILDYSMPDMSGIEFIKQVKTHDSVPKIIMLSMHDEPVIIQEAIAAGIDGYVLKKSLSDELILAVQTVMRGKPFWSAEVGHQLFQRARQDDYLGELLTNRENEVLRLIIKELTSKEIAARLFISERTVEVHRKNIMRKVKCFNTVGLIKYAFLKGLVSQHNS